MKAVLRRLPVLGQFLRFGAVGTAGFVVDSAVLLGMIALGLGPYAGRAVSYLAAATFTWGANRAWTFRADAGADAGRTTAARQWGRFVLLNLVGFALNYGTYAALIVGVPAVAAQPVIGVAAGSLAGMFANFVLSRRYVFRAA